LGKTQSPLKDVPYSITSCQHLNVFSDLKIHFFLILKKIFKCDKAEPVEKLKTFNIIEKEEIGMKKRESTGIIESIENNDNVQKCKDDSVTNSDLAMETDSNKMMTETTNEARIINKRKQNKDSRPHGIIRLTDIYGQEVSMQDILEIADKKIKYLHEENMRLIRDIKENDQVGQELVNCIEENGTKAEVRKLLTHISQVEQVTNLLMLLTIMLDRNESKESRDQELLKTKVKITKQLRDADHLRQYTIDQGKALRPMLSRYSKEFWPRFELFMEVKVRQIVEQRQLKEELCNYEQTRKMLSTDFSFLQK